MFAVADRGWNDSSSMRFSACSVLRALSRILQRRFLDVAVPAQVESEGMSKTFAADHSIFIGLGYEWLADTSGGYVEVCVNGQEKMMK